MKAGWLDELLPQAMLSPRTRAWWLLFFVLFPLAYAGGVALEFFADTPMRVAGAEDRAAAIRTAQQFAASKGYSVAGWHQAVEVQSHEDLLAYYTRSKDKAIRHESWLAPARVIQVLFRPPDQGADFRVYLSLTGRVVGYRISKSVPHSHGTTSNAIGIQSSDSGDDDDEGATRPAVNENAVLLARRALAGSDALLDQLTLGKPKITQDSDDSSRTEVMWTARPPDAKQLTFYITVGLRASDVINADPQNSGVITVGLHDPDVVEKRIEAATDSGRAKSESKHDQPKYVAFFLSVYVVFLIFGAIYGIYRYAKRTLQKEVSHLRTLVVAALFSVSYGTYLYSVGMDIVVAHMKGKTYSEVEIAVYAGAFTVFGVLGLLVGISYGSGEGEVREAFPGKLTSLDALLVGRLFSKDVAASVLFGAAVAGWLLLVQNGLGHFLELNVIASQGRLLGFAFARYPWPSLLIGEPYDALVIATGGLLLPASFLLRRGVRKRSGLLWLIAFALCAVSKDAAARPTMASALLALIVFVAGLLLPFFAFDLLSSMVCLAALAYVSELAELSAAFPSWSEFSLWFAAVAVAGLAAAFYNALSGSRVREEDVRPLYAKNLAERMSMQAEILAAREAQLRLLPQSVPETPGLQMAACCLPAHGVGGDFYDFFRLDASRIGIFVAQGGDQGLASALCIALAKGVLMHTSLLPYSPTQIILELEASIGRLLEGGSANRLSFAYGVIDTRRNLLSYARVGASPRLVVYRAHAPVAASSQLERIVTVAQRAKGAPQVFEGVAHTQPGDYLIFFTDGITCLRSRRFGNREFQWLDILMRELSHQDTPLQAALASTLAKYHRHAKDDLTAVVLRAVKSEVLAQEVVA